jgi:hypothetical protein
MNSWNAIQQELNDLGSSLPLTNNEQPVFTVPEGYFENFAASVLAKVKSQSSVPAADELNDLSPVLAAIPKQTPYYVPEDYFTHLATGLPAFVNDEALPDFLKTHTKQMPYQVPIGYFDGLAAQVAAKVTKPRTTAKVLHFSPRFMRYAAAAVVTGAIAIAAFFYGNGNGNSPDPETQSGAWVAQKLKNVPKRDIEAFLKTVDTDLNSKEVASKGGKTEVRQMLHDVSTQELDAFLKEMPTDNDLSNIN